MLKGDNTLQLRRSERRPLPKISSKPEQCESSRKTIEIDIEIKVELVEEKTDTIDSVDIQSDNEEISMG